MIENFEDITEELSEGELSLIPILVKGFSLRTSDKPVKAPDIIKMVNRHLEKTQNKTRLTEPRLRKCVNHIRRNGMIPLIATSKGYYTSYEKPMIESQIRSLRQRANSIMDCAVGLEVFLKPKQS